MEKLPSHGSFDIDGTLTHEKQVPAEIITGFKDIQSAGMITTVITGKGRPHAQHLFGQMLKQVISPTTIAGFENSGRITTLGGHENIQYFPLLQEEITAFLLKVPLLDLDFFAYYRENPRDKSVLWTTGNNDHAAELKSKYEFFANITNDPLTSIAQRMTSDQPCMLAMKPRDPAITADIFQELTGINLNCVRNEGAIDMNHEGINKGHGVLTMRDILDLRLGILPNLQLEQMMVAGNDLNDISMLNLPVGQRVIVGNKLDGIIAMPHVNVSTAIELGQHLSKLAKQDQ